MRWLAALAMFALAGLVTGAERFVGSPPVQHIAPDIDVHPQNFAVVQDREGIVYVGNAEGVLEFNGEGWRLLRLPNQEIVRSLLAAPDGRVYVGGYNSFGYLDRRPTGELIYRELALKFKDELAGREFADIWDIAVAPEGVYFRAVRDVFLWNPKSDATGHWHHEGRFGGIVHHGGETLLQFRGEGFKRRTADGWMLLPESAPLTELVYGLLPLPDGGLLTRGSDGAWWRLGDGALTKATMPPGMPPSSQFESALRLADGSLAFASRGGVVYLVAADRASERHFKVAPGFLTDMQPAVDGGFLLASEQAIHRVAWPAPWIVLGSEHGADGSLENVADWDGDRWLLTSSGARRVVRAPGGSISFEPDPWDPVATFDLLGIGPGRALVARAHKLMLAEDGRLRALTDELVYPRLLRRSRFDPNRIWLGTEMGLRAVTLGPGTPLLSPAFGDGEAMRINSIAQTAPDEVWTGSERDGVSRHVFAADGTLKARERLGPEQGIAYGPIAEGFVERFADGTLVVSTREGWFRRQGERFVPWDGNGLKPLRRAGESLRLVQAPDGNLWAYGVTRLFRKPARGAWQEQDIASLRRGGLATHHFEDDGSALFVGGQALLLQGTDAAADATPAREPQVRLDAVTLILPNGRLEPQPLQAARPVRLPPDDTGIRFEFSLPELGRGNTQYRSRLKGYEDQWSDWSRSHRATLSHLRPGNYTFEVQAKDSHGRVSSTKAYPMRAEPRWHQSFSARLLAVLVLMVVLWMLAQAYVRQRTFRLAQQKKQLEDIVARRTGELAELNRRLETMAHIDVLTGIPNRRRLDEYLGIVWEQCGERCRPLSLLAIDVDRFKDFNDRQGHLAGDELLRQLALTLGHCLRRSEDLLARYGGEEFLAVLPGADLAVATTLAEKMRKEVETQGLGATVSIGVASRVPDASASLTELVARADAALYVAKKSGRNRVEVAYAPAPKPAPSAAT